MSTLPYSVVVPTDYGQMIVNRHDINQTNALFKTGQAVDHLEITLLGRIVTLLAPAGTVLDIGANFGTYSLGLAAVLAPGGKVYAFEPQRLIFNMLVGSVALNSISNVYCYNMALGDSPGEIEIPQFDYTKPLNFGSIEFGAEQREPLQQDRVFDPARAERVPVTTVDNCNLTEVTLMKIDVEGMEPQVLAGAEGTIARDRPVLYVEHLKIDRNSTAAWLVARQYMVYDMGMNFLCVPLERGGALAPLLATLGA